MKKTLVALAIAGAFSGAAFAQSSVTLYGIVDAGFRITDYARDGASNKTELASGMRNGNRLGFRGAEDLGGGMKAIFAIENGFSPDTGELGQNGRIFGRQAWVALDGNFGTVSLGRMAAQSSGTGSYDVFSDIDPFYTGYQGLQNTFSSAGSLRLDNAVLYRTPNISGFRAGVMYSFQANGGAPLSEVAGNANNTRVMDLAVSFGAGPFYGAITYDQIQFPKPTTGSTPDNQKHLQIGATYDLKIVKLHAAWAKEDNQRIYNPVGTTNGADAKAWMLGISAPIGNGKLMASYQDRNGSALGTYEADRKVWGIGYEYSLSKRTMLHAVFSDSEGKKSIAKSVGASTDGYNWRIYTLGMTHFF